MDEKNILVQEYAKNPIHNYAMENPTITQHEGNFICEDDITVYLKIENTTIVDWSFDGDCSTITTAAASFFSDIVIGKSLEEVLSWTYATIKQEWFEVSRRRRRAATIALLATRNAIHLHLNDGKRDEFDDLIDV